MDIATILLQLLKRAKQTPPDAAAKAGIAQPTFWRLLNGKSAEPKAKTLLRLAEHFGVTIQQLRGEQPIEGITDGRQEPPPVMLPSDEREWLGLYRETSARGRALMLKIAEAIKMDLSSKNVTQHTINEEKNMAQRTIARHTAPDELNLKITKQPRPKRPKTRRKHSPSTHK